MRSRFRQLLDWLHWPELKRQPPPKPAIAIVVVGVLACGVAAYAQTIEAASESAHLEWVKTGRIPDSKAVAVPGGEQKMRLTDGTIRATGLNFSHYELFQVNNVLEVEAEAPIGNARIVCAIQTFRSTEIAQSASGGLRALYPRSSEGGIYGQPVPELVILDFSSHGHNYAIVEANDPESKWTTERGVKLEWPHFVQGTEHLKYFVAGGKPTKTLRLPFNSIWKTQVAPKATTSCTVHTSAGKSTVTQTGSLKISPPIDEEAEELNQEQTEAEEGEEAESEDEAGGETE